MTTNVLTLTLASGESLDVRDFSVEEGMSRLFDIQLTAVSPSTDVDFEAAVGGAARFEILRTSSVDGETRYWNGICVRAEMTGVEEQGLSSYAVRIVPAMWLLTQRRNYRVFQDKSELDIALEMLAGWGIEPALELDAGSYGKRRMRVQYAETDFDFVNRLLEEIGVAYFFEQAGGETRLVLADAPNRRGARAPVRFLDKPIDRTPVDYVTDVRTYREVRPGRYTQSDVDYRKPLNYPLAASSSRGGGVETRLERYHHDYGSFLWKGQGGDTPVADDRGAARTNEREGGKQVEKRLEAERVEARGCRFRTTAHDLRPGKVFTIDHHPRAEIGAPQLVIAGRFQGNAFGEWTHTCESRYTDVDYRPPLRTPKPRTHGVESATVTGPSGEEIHCDEFGRVRVHFHWDREGAADETSSCWVPVSQAWAGAGFGAINLPRVGQEVLVDFLGADPDRPLVMGRVFTTTTPPPYQLPKYKMVSGLRSETYPRAKSGGGARMGGGPVAMGPRATPEPPMAALGSKAFSGNDAAGLRRPAGGGMPVDRLGGDGSPGVSAPTGSGTDGAMPGIFGGQQAPPEELSGAVNHMKSLGPDSMDHNRSANGLVFDDTSGSEKTYLQAQTDLAITVKRNLTGSVGANRAYSVLGNDFETIPKGYQATEVGKDRTVDVKGDQTHRVKGDIAEHGESNRAAFIKQNIYTEAKEGGQVHTAKTGYLMKVEDKAAIVITPTAIVIDAPKVFINPGRDVMEAIYAGASPEEAVAARQREDRIQKATEAMLKANVARQQASFGSLDLKADSSSLVATSKGANTPYSLAATQAGVTDRGEINEAARRANDIMYVTH